MGLDFVACVRMARLSSHTAVAAEASNQPRIPSLADRTHCPGFSAVLGFVLGWDEQSPCTRELSLCINGSDEHLTGSSALRDTLMACISIVTCKFLRHAANYRKLRTAFVSADAEQRSAAGLVMTQRQKAHRDASGRLWRSQQLVVWFGGFHGREAIQIQVISDDDVSLAILDSALELLWVRNTHSLGYCVGQGATPTRQQGEGEKACSGRAPPDTSLMAVHGRHACRYASAA